MSQPSPPKARAAAVLFGAYGLLLLAGVVALQAGVPEATGLDRVGIRVVAIWVIAVALWRGAEWAWMAGLALPGLWLLLGGFSLFQLLGGGPEVAVPLPSVLFVGAALLVLATGWSLLLSREVRSAFRS